jgi:hypothetical protein
MNVRPGLMLYLPSRIRIRRPPFAQALALLALHVDPDP